MCVELGVGGNTSFSHPAHLYVLPEIFLCRYRKTGVRAYLLLFRFAFLHFIDNCIFYKVKVRSNAALIKSVGAIFPTAFTHFVTLSHFGNSWTIASFFVIIFVRAICDE